MLLLLRLWESGTREMDNERSTQGTSAPLLPLLQRFQNIQSSKEEPIPEEEAEVKMSSPEPEMFLFISPEEKPRNLSNKMLSNEGLLCCCLAWEHMS